MKHKAKIIATLIITLALMSQVVGCAVVSQTDLAKEIQAGENIEITVAVPSYVEEAKGVEQEFNWERLDKLETYDDEFRPSMDKLFNITRVTVNGEDSKNGCMYVNKDGYQDGNTCLMDALRNKVFMEKYMGNHETLSGINELVSKIYTDTNGDGDGMTVYSGLNAYYDLFSDGKSKDSDSYYSNINQSLTRADFYSFLYRVNNGVTDLNENAPFNEQVGAKAGLKAKMASQVEDNAWLNTSNTGLRAGNYESAITKAEVVYALANYYYYDELKDYKAEKDSLVGVTDAGSMLNIGREKLSIKNEETGVNEAITGWQLGVLYKMMESTRGSMHSDIYKDYSFLKDKGVSLDCEAYQETVTKYEAIDMIYKIASALNEEQGYVTDCENGIMDGNGDVAVVNLDNGDIDDFVYSDVSMNVINNEQFKTLNEEKIKNGEDSLLVTLKELDLADPSRYETTESPYNEDGTIKEDKIAEVEMEIQVREDNPEQRIEEKVKPAPAPVKEKEPEPKPAPKQEPSENVVGEFDPSLYSEEDLKVLREIGGWGGHMEDGSNVHVDGPGGMDVDWH